MKILILGAKGGLGTQLVEIFSKGNEVLGWDKSEVDITDRELILRKTAEIKPELVINAAAYNAVDKCENIDEEYELAKKINIDGPKFLAEVCLKLGATLVHYSTDYVFDGLNNLGYNETEEPKPINRYGKTKLHGEKRILELSGQGLKWYLIRTAKLFGPSGSSEMAKPNFFDLMIKASQLKADFSADLTGDNSLKTGVEAGGSKTKALEVVDDELSCFTYTPDLAKATKELVMADKGYGIYHLTNRGACTWYQSAVELFRLTNANTVVVPISGVKLARPAKRPKCSVLLNTKLPQLRDYREALKEYLISQKLN